MKKVLIVLSILTISSFSFADNKLSVEESVRKLEMRLQNLAKKEEEKISIQGNLALEAEKKLNEYKIVEKVVDERITDIETNLGKVIFSKEFKIKLEEYKQFKRDLAREIARETKIIEEFKLFNLMK